jgi:hypothetical protein
MTAPWITGEWINAVKLTTRVEKYLDELEAAYQQLAGLARQTTVHSINNATWTAVQHNTADINLGSGFPAPGTWTDFAVPAGLAGTYRMESTVQWSGASATGHRFARFVKNGSTPIPSYTSSSTAAGSPGSVNATSVWAVADLLEGDTVTVQAWQNSGGALSTRVDATDAAYSVFGIWRVY